MNTPAVVAAADPESAGKAPERCQLQSLGFTAAAMCSSEQLDSLILGIVPVCRAQNRVL